jgi:hypothetical protein
MGHSSGNNAGNVFLSALKQVIVGVLKITFLIIAFAIGLAGTILVKISEVIKSLIK